MSKALSLVAYNDLESQVEALERDGYVYFPNVLNAEEIAELRAMMDRLETIPECLDRHQVPQNGDGFLNKIINNSFNRDSLYLQFLDKSPVIEVAEATHGEDCHCIGMQSWITGPGRPDQGYIPIGCRSVYRQTFVPIHASKFPSSSPPLIIISMICTRNWDRRSSCRAAISQGVPQTEQLNGTIGVKRVSYAMRGTWCFSAAKSGIVVLPIRVTKPVTSCRYTMPCG